MPVTSLPTFTRIGTLRNAHSRPINLVKISRRNEYLLSGGDDGFLKVWALDELDVNDDQRPPIQSISTQGFGAVSAGTWVERAGTSAITLAFGSSGGRTFLYSWDKSTSTFTVQDFHDLPNATRVDDVAFDPAFSRLAIASAHGVFLFNVSSTGKLDQATVSVPPVPGVTISRVLFTDRGSVLVVSYVENHKCKAFRINPWGPQWDETLLTRVRLAEASVSGCSAIGPDNHMAVTNLYSGVDILPVPPRVPVHHFPHPILVNRPLQVCFLSRDVIVFGSEDGYVTIWDWHLGESCQLIHAKPGTPVQVVDANMADGDVLIASGISGDCRDFSVKVWAPEIIQEAEGATDDAVQDTSNASSNRDYQHRPAISTSQILLIVALCLLGQTLVSQTPGLLRQVLSAVETFRRQNRGGDGIRLEDIPAQYPFALSLDPLAGGADVYRLSSIKLPTSDANKAGQDQGALSGGITSYIQPPLNSAMSCSKQARIRV
ncbi:WD40-repeat-containing domain protein [Coprinopsis sp. MPI-PUGE-AT-0042]|nr:WD40-repeat-containing domain protein [Coprinopsis sp. MPI-PUGE-AT-0042]